MSTTDDTPTPIDPLTVPWRPTVDDVAALLRARTKDASGQEVGTFTDETRPLAVEVEMLITNGCAKIASLVGWTFSTDAYDEARHLSALVAACEVELSYYPEQIRTDRSAYTQLWQMFTENRDAFASYVSSLSPAGSLGTKVGSFYVASPTIIVAYQYGYLAVPLSDLVNV